MDLKVTIHCGMLGYTEKPLKCSHCLLLRRPQTLRQYPVTRSYSLQLTAQRIASITVHRIDEMAHSVVNDHPDDQARSMDPATIW
jgi:hypothetical protein